MPGSIKKCTQVLVTGADGFVGNSLCSFLETAGYSIIRAVRNGSKQNTAYDVGDISESTDWSAALKTAPDTVVHLAAVMPGKKTDDKDSLSISRQVNTQGTLNFASQCAASDVKRFVFLSSVKVLGEGGETPYTCEDSPAPVGAYAVSKQEAEQGLQHIAEESGLELVILRPVLVYGPGVKSNFFSLLKAVDIGVPFPFASINNRRSLIYLGNLVDAIRICIDHPEAAGKSFLVSDGDDVSTPELLHRIGLSLNKPVRCFPVSSSLFRFAGKILGKEASVQRLFGSLAVDSSSISKELNWFPPFGMSEGLAETVKWYIKEK